MALLYLAWKHGGEDPYRLYHGLGPDYTPVDDPTASPRPPAHPGRLRAVIYAFAAVANDVEAAEKGVK